MLCLQVVSGDCQIAVHAGLGKKWQKQTLQDMECKSRLQSRIDTLYAQPSTLT